ncbi:4Fe-4S dicluster domain-containing protein [Moorella sulfitireducens]|uniref:4Fe-4S dicluster domain-containing protein n=1 Tax=Neomoorella sulfitireducens TaxID=2972948 RepID=UPI0021AC5427|nr:4Fe-4S dicluster domain-containing protein [Moorella sulfitireducens]
MCRYCVEFGNGTKWYLNPENYRRELYEAKGHAYGFNMLAGAGKNTFETGSLVHFEDQTPDYKNAMAGQVAVDLMTQHSGQVVPLEDAVKILEMVPGDRFLLMHCSCRRYFGHGDVYSCLFFEPAVEKALAERPWETDSKIITKEEAIKMEYEWDKKGLIHNVLDVGTDADGKPPIVMCHCNATDCMPTNLRLALGHRHALRKGEYVAKVDLAKCREGCKSFPACVARCNFGAIKYNPLEKVVYLEPTLCFGCGLCRAVCPTKAIELVDRTTYPALVDEW